MSDSGGFSKSNGMNHLGIGLSQAGASWRRILEYVLFARWKAGILAYVSQPLITQNSWSVVSLGTGRSVGAL